LWEALFSGFYPRIHDQRLDPTQWLESYVATYVERDVRSLREVGSLASFSRFLKLCAGRSATLLNLSSLAGDAGIAVNTAKAWLAILEASFVVFLLQPHHESFNKRLVKAPKLHFYDPGLLVYLLGIRSAQELEHHAKRGDIFESFVMSELLKERHHRPHRFGLYHFRDSRGHEIDGLIEDGARRIPIEVKSGQTVRRDFFSGLNYWTRLSGGQARGLLVYGGDENQVRTNHDVVGWRGLMRPRSVLSGELTEP